MAVMAFLGLGSNIGERLANLQAAVEELDRQSGLRVSASSRIWETDPVGGPPQPDFLNAVVQVETDLEPLDLLGACHRVESALGRVRDVRNGPRTIDIDVLLFDMLTLDDPRLSIPHPRMTQRGFVMLPLMDLDPHASLPDGTPLAAVRLGPASTAGARPFAPPLVVVR